jgi:hypothetical protein
MVWIYDDPPYTSRELRAYAFLKKKLKDKKFVDSLIKLLSLAVYLKTHKFKTVKEIKESAYYDKAKTKPIFDDKTAKAVLKGFHQKGGIDPETIKKSKYPYLSVMLRGFALEVTPNAVRKPVSELFGLLTGSFDMIKKLPFAEILLDLFHGVAELGVTTANDAGEVVAGPVGAAAVAPFTAVVAGLASIVATAEGDLGGAVAHVVNWIPAFGIVLNKAMLEMEHLAIKLKDYERVSGFIPYMTEYHDFIKTNKLKERPDPPPDVSKETTTPPDVSKGEPKPTEATSTQEDPQQVTAGGKRLSTRKRKGRKWQKTMRRRRSAMY